MNKGQTAPKSRTVKATKIAIVSLSARHDALLGSTTDENIKVESPQMYLHEVHKVPTVVLGESAMRKNIESLELDTYMVKHYGRNKAYSSRPEVRAFLRERAVIKAVEDAKRKA